MKITIIYKLYNKMRIELLITYCVVKTKQLKLTHPSTIIFDRRMTP